MQISNDWMDDEEVMGEQNFAKFEFKMRFVRISDIAQGPGLELECKMILIMDGLLAIFRHGILTHETS